MKVALIAFGNEESYGLLFVGGELLEHFQEIRFFDAERDDVEDQLVEWEPEFIFFSPMTAFYPAAARVARNIKSWLPHVVTVFGGHHATSRPQIVDSAEVDVVVVGPVRLAYCACSGQTASVASASSRHFAVYRRHPGTGSGGLSRRMRSRMVRKSHRGTATSVIWKITYRAVRHHLRTDFDELLSERRKRPVLNRPRQPQPPKEVPQVVRQGEQLESHLVVHEIMATQAGPLHRILSFFYPLLRRTAAVVELHHAPRWPSKVGHDESHAREQLALMMLDLRHYPAGLIPTAGLVEEVVVPDDRLVGWPAHRPSQQRLDLTPQHLVGGESDRVAGSVPLPGIRTISGGRRWHRPGRTDGCPGRGSGR